MKKVLLAVALLVGCYTAKAQVVTLSGTKVEVRDLKGSYISSNSYSGISDAVGGDGIVVLLFANGKVEVRDSKLTYIASNTYSGLKSVRASGKNVVLQYASGKLEVRDSKLTYISSR